MGGSIAQQLTRDGTVPELALAGRAPMERAFEGGVAGEHDHPPALELAEALAELEVERLHALLASRLEAIAVGRIAHDEAGRQRRNRQRLRRVRLQDPNVARQVR